MKNVLVTGANGFVGSHLVETLLKQKVHVRCLVRRTSNLQWIEHLDVELIYGELRDIESLHMAVKGIDTIFHAGARTKGRTQEEFFIDNAQGTKNLLEAVKDSGIKLGRFVFLSSQAATGPSADGELIQESAIPNPVTWYGESKSIAEEIVRAYSRIFPITILRPPTVYGPRDRDVFEMFKTIHKGFQFKLWPGERYISIIHVHDLVRACIMAAQHPNAVGETFFVVSQPIISVDELNQTIAHALNKKTVPIYIPFWIFTGIVGLIEMWNRLQGSLSILNWQKLNEYEAHYWVCDGSKAVEVLGFQPEKSLEEGVEETVAWYREQGWLS